MANEPSPGHFRVDPVALTTLARELDAQIDALSRPMGHMVAAASRPLALGRFAEAGELARQHAATAEAMDELLRLGRDALAFAAEVTATIAAGYADHDRAVADSYRITGGAS